MVETVAQDEIRHAQDIVVADDLLQHGLCQRDVGSLVLEDHLRAECLIVEEGVASLRGLTEAQGHFILHQGLGIA